MNGALGLSDERKEMRVSYRGDAALVSVRMLDKITNDSFLRWSSFSASGINFSLGAGRPKVHIAALDLGNFYARIILNSDGRLNLRDVTASPEQAPTSLTRAHGAPGATPAAPAAHASVHTIGKSNRRKQRGSRDRLSGRGESGCGAQRRSDSGRCTKWGEFTLHDGQVNYSDNFIKPNYSADLTEISGKVGTFGTETTTPASVELDGQVNGNAPLDHQRLGQSAHPVGVRRYQSQGRQASS